MNENTNPVQTEKDQQENVLKLGKNRSIKLQTISYIFTVVAFLMATCLYISDAQVTRGYLEMGRASEKCIEAQEAATDLKIGSDYLTDRVRSFVVTGDIQYLNDYYMEVEETRSREHAVEDLDQLLQDQDDDAYVCLTRALEWSNELILQEKQAMRYILETGDYDETLIPEDLKAIDLTRDEEALGKDGLKKKALDLVLGQEYIECKELIMENIDQCTDHLIEEANTEMQSATSRMSVLQTVQTILAILLIVIAIAFVVFISFYIRKPLSQMVEMMKAKKTVPPAGVEEIRSVTETYNEIFEENQKTKESLLYDAMHDQLTGLFNRQAFDTLPKDIDMDHAAILVLDIDHFKTVNDTYGHDVGDEVLKFVSDTLRTNFRSVDYIFRFGGDEFVVIMTRLDSTKKDLVIGKVDHINQMLKSPGEHLPVVRISAGAAFSDRKNPQGDLFKDADTALYQMKEAGGSGCRIYE